MFTNIDQTIRLTIELVQAVKGDNSYGGNTAEIYAYTLMPYNPSASRSGHSTDDVIKASKSLEYAIDEVLQWFPDKKCLIDDMDYKKFFELHDHEFTHRLHVTFEDKYNDH